MPEIRSRYLRRLRESIVVVTNLKPAELRGYVSQGMLLAGKENENYAVVEVNGLKPGTKIM